MAESQSDERLAQELNPQTETGMLGPTWLPASELSFREKMRSGAQAQQQQNNLPIIDQLAQSAMMPQGMPPQGMPQQMPPQQMMPQEPMPQGMPPQMMAEGGIIGGDMSGIGLMKNMMEEGGMQGLLQILSNKEEDEDLDQVNQRAMASGGLIGYANGGQVMTLDDLLQRSFQDYYDPTQANPDQLTFPRDTTYDTDPFGLDKYPDVNVPSDRETLDNLTQELLNRQTDGKTLEAGTANTNRDPEPLTVIGKDQVGGGISGINPDENNYPDLEEILTERRKATGAILPGIISGVKNIGQKTAKGYLDLVGPEILAAEGLDPNLYDPDWVDLVSSDDKKTTEKQDDKKPTETKVLEEIQQQDQGEIPANTYYDPVNEMLIDKATGKEFDGGLPKGAPQTHGPDGTEITSKVTSIVSDTTGQALQKDVMQAEQQRLNELKDQIFKGNMDRKWMAIAAGAFNAAQKGSPTLMQGLADLGGGVTEELQKMDKEDQDRAMALYEIYIQEATLAETKRKNDLTFQASKYGDDISWAKSIAERLGKSVDDVLNATKAFDTAKKNKTLGDFGTEQYIGSVIDYADMGVTSASLEYNQEVGKLNAKEQEILKAIEDFDPNNSDHIAEARKEMTEYLNDNPSMKLLYNDYWSKRATQDEKGETIPFDISSSLIIRPPTG